LARSPVRLKIAIADYPHTRAIKDGSIAIDGVISEFVNVVPQIAAFRRMVRDVEFDVCELAPTTYIIARAFGAPFIALPVFVMRRFHHQGILVRPDAGIASPKDLEGKRVGVRAYSVTTGVWTRGILINEFSVDSARVNWVVDDEEHVRQLKLPANVTHAPEGHSLARMMAEGGLHAAFDGNAGIGRAGPPEAGWLTTTSTADYADLFPDGQAQEADWFRRTAIYPMHGTIVVKESVLAEHPFVARALFDAFNTAKMEWLSRLAKGEGDTLDDRKYRLLQRVVGNDPLPHGIAQNRATIDALETYAFQQGLISRRLPLEEVFVDPEKA
jgi:4,5-dihydroxyphthalate decarboxylase